MGGPGPFEGGSNGRVQGFLEGLNKGFLPGLLTLRFFDIFSGVLLQGGSKWCMRVWGLWFSGFWVQAFTVYVFWL